MKTCVKKIFRWTAALGSVMLIACITSLITTQKTVWITLKRKEESPYNQR